MFQKVSPWVMHRFDWRATDTSWKTSKTLYLETITAFFNHYSYKRKKKDLCVRAHHHGCLPHVIDSSLIRIDGSKIKTVKTQLHDFEVRGKKKKMWSKVQRNRNYYNMFLKASMIFQLHFREKNIL